MIVLNRLTDSYRLGEAKIFIPFCKKKNGVFCDERLIKVQICSSK